MGRLAVDATTAGLLQIAKEQVDAVQTQARQVLHCLSGTGESELELLAESLRDSAVRGDTAFERATKDRPAAVLTFSTFDERREYALQENGSAALQLDLSKEQPGTLAPDSLAWILDAVRGASRAELCCVAPSGESADLLSWSASTRQCEAAAAREVQLRIPGVLRASIAISGQGPGLRQLTVALFSPVESTHDKDAWSTSEFLVFRRLSVIAVQASEHFQLQSKAEGRSGADALFRLLLWLCQYRNLFSEKCKALGVLLAADAGQNLTPPLLRPFRQATLPSLLREASPLLSCPAYHLHAVPSSLL